MIFTVLFSLFFGAAHPQGELIERVVAVVDRQALTLLEVKRTARLEIAKRSGLVALSTPIDAAFLNHTRTHIVQQILLLNEAHRAAFPVPTAQEVENSMKSFIQRFPDQESFSRLLKSIDINIDDLRDFLRKDLLAEKFLDSRIQSRLELTPQEIAQYQTSHSQLTSQQALEQLKAEKFVARSRAYIDELMTRADIKFIGDLGDQ